MKTIIRNADGSLSVRSETIQKTLAGVDIITATQWEIQPHQVDRHRAADPSIDTDADAPTRRAMDIDRATRNAEKKP